MHHKLYLAKIKNPVFEEIYSTCNRMQSQYETLIFLLYLSMWAVSKSVAYLTLNLDETLINSRRYKKDISSIVSEVR